MLIIQSVTDATIEIDPTDRSGQKILDQCKTFSPEQQKVIFKSLIESGKFFEAAAFSLSLNNGPAIRHSANVVNLCMNFLSEGEKKEITGLLIKEGFYNVAAELAESTKDVSFVNDVYGEISIYGAEKNDIFLVTQFADSMHHVQKKDDTLERAAKIIAERGSRWIGSSDLKEIIKGISDKAQRDKVTSDCKELIGNRKV